jgi:DnaJ-class molecular chaperone
MSNVAIDSLDTPLIETSSLLAECHSNATCPECDGTGSILVVDPIGSRGGGETETQRCQECRGNGVVTL